MAIQNINAGDEWGVIRSALNSNFTLLDSKSIGTGIVIDADKFFADEAARDAYFTSQPNNGQIIAVLHDGNNYNVQQYYNTTWNNIAFGVKVDNTIFPTISAWAINENGELEYQGVVRVKELIADPGTVSIGDSSLKSGFRIITTKSKSTGNQAAFALQLFDENGFKAMTTFDENQISSSYIIQSNDVVTAPSNSISFKEVCQYDEVRLKKRFKPAGGVVTSDFTYTVRPAIDAEPVFLRQIKPEECIDVGGGTFEFDFDLLNPTAVDVGTELFITIEGITLLGDNFDGTDGIHFGDASNGNFFPYIGATKIPIVRKRVATEDDLIKPLINSYMSTNQAITTADQTINFNTIVETNKINLTAGEFEFLEAGVYEGMINYYLYESGNPTLGIWVECKHAGGNWELCGLATKRYYPSDTGSGHSIDGALRIQAGDKLRVRVKMFDLGDVAEFRSQTFSTDIGNTTQNAASITIKQISK